MNYKRKKYKRKDINWGAPKHIQNTRYENTRKKITIR